MARMNGGLPVRAGAAALAAAIALAIAPARADDLFLKVDPPVLDAKKCSFQPAPKIDRDWTAWSGGDPAAAPDVLLDVADVYAKGTEETPQNVETAKRLLTWLVEKKTKVRSSALFALGKLALENSTDPKEIGAAIALMEQAVKERSSGAAVALGQYYEAGRVIRRDPTKAAAYYRIGATAGDVQAILGLARLAKAGALPDMSPQAADETVHFALTSLLAAVGRGDCQQAFSVASLYAVGDIVPLDLTLAAHWFEAVAKLGHAKAAEQVARYYKDGFGVAMSAPKMVFYLEIAAKGGRARSMYNLAQAHAIGDGTPPDRAKAQFWFEKAEKGGKREALRWLAQIWRGDFGGPADPAKSVSYLQRDAALPNPDKKTYHELGLAYRDGYGVKPDIGKAIGYLSQAAMLGQDDAAQETGDIYRQGSGVPVDAMKAARFYRLAAATGNVGAMSALSEMHRCGIGVAWSPELARRWSERAAYAGSGSNLRSFALTGVPADDPDRRLRFLRRAAQYDNREAMLLLHLAYANGAGAPRDPAAAKRWLDAALAPGDGQVRGYVALAQIHAEGQGVPADMDEARAVLEEAARIDKRDGGYELGRFLRDRTAAGAEELRPLFLAAAQAGNPKAMRALANDMGPDETAGGRTGREWFEAAAAGGEVRASIAMLRTRDDPAAIEAGLDRIAAAGACQPDQMADLASAYLALDAPAAQEKGMTWLDRAAKIGSADPGVLFVLGTSLASAGDQDARSRGAELLTTAAEQGSVKAMRNLAEGYEAGDDADLDKAELWHEKAAEAGNLNSAVDYAKIIAATAARRTPEQLARARELLRKSAEGLPDAARQLGLISLRGVFGAEARIEAVQWLEKAAASGDPKAMRDLSDAYSIGNGVARDPRRAVYWLEESAKHGNGAAMFALGAAYEAGFGAPANPGLARKWYAAAKAAGYAETMK